MAFRVEKALGVIAFTAALAQAAEFRFEARHDHLRKSGPGTLTIDDSGVGFEEKTGKHTWRWRYDDIQQLRLSPERLQILTYRDNKWKLGADRSYEFRVDSGRLKEAHPFLRSRLDQRFVAALADTGAGAIWEMPVKHRLRFGGSEGVLRFGDDGIVYSTEKREASRSWRWDDIENISSSGPFDLTITSFERSRWHYGDRKAFNFQLKQRLDEARYNRIWRRANQGRLLGVLDLHQERDDKQ